MRRRRGFTLVELVIGTALMLIMSGGITTSYLSGVNMYKLTEANSLVIDSLRMTSEETRRNIQPIIQSAYSVSIGSTAPPTAGLTDDDHYIYAADGSVRIRYKSDDAIIDSPFAGSEYISELKFTLPPDSASSGDNYLLGMAVTASPPNFPKAAKSIDMRIPLINMPDKEPGSLADGAVLHFKVAAGMSIKLNVSLDIFLEGTWRNVNNTVALDKNSVIVLEHQAKAIGNGIEYAITGLQATYQWYAAFDKDFTNPVPITSGVTNKLTVLSDMSGSSYWPGDETYIKCLATYTAVLDNGSVISSGPLWSPFASIFNIEEEHDLWDDWLGNTPYISDVNQSGNMTITRAGGIMTMKVTNKASHQHGASTLALLDYQYMNNSKLYSIWSNYMNEYSSALPELNVTEVPSFMTMTNYSVILDFQAANNINSVWVYLSDTPGNNSFSPGSNSAFKDIGFAIRFYKDSNTMKVDAWRHQRESTELDEGYGAKTTQHTSGAFSTINGYNPWTLLNKAVTTWTGNWNNKRQRVQLTVCEYYTDSKAEPKYIIRVRFLKPAEESNASKLLNDPWCTGAEYNWTEPMWFGLLPGTSLIPSGSGYKAIVKHYDGDSGNSTISETPLYTVQEFSSPYLGSGSNYYSTQFNNTAGYNNSSITQMNEMDIVEATSDDSHPYVSDPARMRYIGLHASTTGNYSSNNTVKVYGLDLAPGFSIDELKSMLPAGAKMYEIDETVSASRRAAISGKQWYSHATDINSTLFGGNGNGNKSVGGGYNIGSNGRYSRYLLRDGGRFEAYSQGIYGLQHIPGTFCHCPLHEEIYKWVGTATRQFTAYEVIDAIINLLTYTGANSGYLPNGEESVIHDYFNKNNDPRELDSDGINFSEIAVRELREMSGIDIYGTSWRIYRKSSGKYNIFWTRDDISMMFEHDVISNVYRWAGGDGDATVRLGTSTVDTTRDILNYGIKHTINRISGGEWVENTP